MKRFTYQTFKRISEDIKEKTINNRISNISLINSRDLLISFTTYRKEKLLISLNHNIPFTSFVNIDESFPTILGSVNDNLRKYIRDSLILDVSLLNEDRILQFMLQKTNDYFEKEVRFLVIELIPHRPNVLILDVNKIVLFAIHYSSLQDKYLVVKGLRYESLEKSESYTTDDSLIPINEVKEFAQTYLLEAKSKRVIEKNTRLFKFVSSRIKSLKNKIKVLDQESDKAKANLQYQEIGSAILSLINNVDELNDYLNSIGFLLKSDISLGDNANLCFKKYKKAKRTLEMNEIEKDKAQEEINKLSSIQASLEYLNEQDAAELMAELLPTKKQESKAKSKSSISFIECDGCKIYYGKSSAQNDELTFKIAEKDHYYIHVKDYHGSHVILSSSNPSNNAKLLGSEIALIMSGLEAGDVYYTQVKNIKKGKSKGEALLSTYTVFTIKNVREETKKALKLSSL